jgi:four helix bundle protein
MTETGHRFGFEKLDVYRHAKELVKVVYRLTADLPSEERFGLTNQIRRAAVSVASNIAEGQGRLSRKDQAHFSQMAYSSLMEIICQADIACELGVLRESGLEEIRDCAKGVAFRLSALHKSQVRSKDQSP